MANGKCVIMVVDDEPMIEECLEEMLQTYGYEHRSFNDPRQAVRYFASDPEGIDLVITDIRMPFITGPELVKKAVEIRPDVPVILVSGESPGDVTSMTNVRAFLRKPIRKAELVDAVVKAIGSGCV